MTRHDTEQPLEARTADTFPAADPGGLALLDASYAWDAMTPAERDAFAREHAYAVSQASLVSVWLRQRAYHLNDAAPAAPARFPTQRKPTT